MCPACSAPIVGTSTTDFPCVRQSLEAVAIERVVFKGLPEITSTAQNRKGSELATLRAF